ncbi:MAG: hypothetical protein HY699_25450 [Deltaproteobacteria bacterium]|nr:hypothetical protein [Deltaproteobacteria bacterium]
MLGDRYTTLAGAQAWAAFLFVSYLFGHLVFLLGSWLDAFYDRARRYTLDAQIAQLACREIGSGKGCHALNAARRGSETTMNTASRHPSISGAILVLAVACLGTRGAAQCTLTQESTFAHAEIGSVTIFRDVSTDAIAFASQMQVNTDGAPDSYHPDDIGITHICNGVSVGPNCTWKAECMPEFRVAKAEGFRGPQKICFFAMANGADGVPIIQGDTDPKPGYFVSTTALRQPNEDPRSPQAQLDSNTVPFAVIPRGWQSTGRLGPKLGDFGVAHRRSNGKLAYFVVGDVGPRNKLGEGSVALHQALGNDPFVMRFGVRRARRGIGGRDVVYLLFPGSAVQGERLDAASIERVSAPLLNSFGGEARIKSCFGR